MSRCRQRAHRPCRPCQRPALPVVVCASRRADAVYSSDGSSVERGAVAVSSSFCELIRAISH